MKATKLVTIPSKEMKKELTKQINDINKCVYTYRELVWKTQANSELSQTDIINLDHLLKAITIVDCSILLLKEARKRL